jgi:hypothetical protein
LSDCFELVQNKKSELVPIASLPNAVLSFGACVSTNGSHIYISGGTTGSTKKSTNECYVYSIDDNTWT